jgi:hypothetical protein
MCRGKRFTSGSVNRRPRFHLIVFVSFVALIGVDFKIFANDNGSPAAPSTSQCPAIKVNCPESVDQGTTITCVATVKDLPANVKPTFLWLVSTGFISSGQGTSEISIDTFGVGGQKVTATLGIGGLDPQCVATAWASTQITAPIDIKALKVAEYGDEIPKKEIEDRLDTYTRELQINPGALGYVVGFGRCRGNGKAKAELARNYLAHIRGIDASRITVRDGGCSVRPRVELWIGRLDAVVPKPNNDEVLRCPKCTKKNRRPRVRQVRKRFAKKTTVKAWPIVSSQDCSDTPGAKWTLNRNMFEFAGEK